MPLRRVLRSADRFNETAILCGSFDLKTSRSRSSALLRFVTFADQRRLRAFDVFFGVLLIYPLNLQDGRFACQSRRQRERLPYNSVFFTHNIITPPRPCALR